jgi:peptide/nickel transport system permease protein
MKVLAALLGGLSRTIIVLLLVTVGATALVRFAPGYLSDAREMDQRYAGTAKTELDEEAKRSGSLWLMLSEEVRGWSHGDLGQSREYGVPVRELLGSRLIVTGGIIARGIAAAWCLAFCAALVSSTRRKRSVAWQLPATLLLALPTAALATLCVIGDDGTAVYPVTVMALLLAARDFKFLDRILRGAWRDPHVLQARAQGIAGVRLLWSYILPGMRSQVLALATLSIVTALSAMVPVEVIFNVPGIGQMAWNAAMNRDLPVLLAVTILNAIAVMAAGGISHEQDLRTEWTTS